MTVSPERLENYDAHDCLWASTSRGLVASVLSDLPNNKTTLIIAEQWQKRKPKIDPKIKTKFHNNNRRLHTVRLQWADDGKRVVFFWKWKWRYEKVFCEKQIISRALLFHHFFYFSRLVTRELQAEDPLHENLSVAVKIQRVWVTDDLIVRVWVQQHRHVTASSSHLNIKTTDVKMLRVKLLERIVECAESQFFVSELTVTKLFLLILKDFWRSASGESFNRVQNEDHISWKAILKVTRGKPCN